MRFFTHEINSRNDDRIFELIDIHGLGGYGFFWVILEELYGSEETGFQVEATNIWMKRLARSLNLTDDRTIIRYFDTLADLGLIDKQLWHERIIYSKGVMERADSYMEKKAKEAEKKRNQRVQAKSSEPCPAPVPRDTLGTKPMSHDVPLSYADPYADPDPHSQANADQTREENTRSENIYASCDENSPDSDLPVNQVLIDCMADHKETPIPPTPFSPSPENVGLAIAAKPKVTSLDTKRNKYQVFLDVWLQEKPDDWVDHKTLSKTAISKLETFVKTHGNESMMIFQKSLWYAKNDSYHKKVLKGWTLEQYLSNEKPYQYYEKYEQAPKKESAHGDSLMSTSEIKQARIFAQIQQAMGVAS